MRESVRHAAGAGVAALVVAVVAACSTGTPPPTATTSQSTLLPTTASTSPTSAPTVLPPSSSGPSSPTSSSTTAWHHTFTQSATTTSPRPTTRTVSPTTTPRPTTCTIPSSLVGKDLTTLMTTRKVVALTFDAGASNAGVSSILATLSKEGVPATFFLTGDFVDEYPSSARAMAKYPVGNHTYNHPDLTDLTDSQVRTEIRTAATRIKAVTGQDPRPYFRFPFGAVDTRTVRLVNGECYVPFRWTVDTLGWKGTSAGQSVSTVVSRVLGAARPGEIVLMHVGSHPTDHSTLDADALPRVISGLRAKGYSFVTLQAVLSSAP